MIFFSFLIRWLVRHRLIEFLSMFKAYSLISKIAIFSTRKINNGSSLNVLCIGRAIFDEEIEEMSNNSGKVNYLVIPKIIFISIFHFHFHWKDFDHINYHADKNLDFEKKAYKNFLDNFLTSLFKDLSIDAVISANYVYSWQQELATICLERQIPFIVLHKEGMTSPSQYKNLVDTYTNGKFIGSRMLVYNDNIKNALLDANIKGITKNNIVTVGVPRFDKYSSIGAIGGDVVFFSFYMEDKLRHISLSETAKSELLNKSINFHLEIMKFAKQSQHINVTIKTKGGKRYLDYVLNIAKSNRLENLHNLKITNMGTPYELIQDAFLVGGLNSSVLLEAMLAKRQVFMPNFKNSLFEDYFIGNEDVVNYVRSSEDLIKCVNELSNKEYSKERGNLFLKEFISIPDGMSSNRAENEIILTIKNKL